MINKDTMNTHKHAGHLITIDGHSFKANDSGMWNLTEIWKVLGLPQGKQPGQWRTKAAQRLDRMQKMHSVYLGQVPTVHADKQATLKYAGWVSEDFEDMVYAAFESILEMPEVAEVVANKMVELGYHAEAELLERHKDDYRFAMQEGSRLFKQHDQRSPERVYEAFKRGSLTRGQALELVKPTSVWSKRIANH